MSSRRLDILFMELSKDLCEESSLSVNSLAYLASWVAASSFILV